MSVCAFGECVYVGVGERECVCAHARLRAHVPGGCVGVWVWVWMCIWMCVYTCVHMARVYVCVCRVLTRGACACACACQCIYMRNKNKRSVNIDMCGHDPPPPHLSTTGCSGSGLVLEEFWCFSGRGYGGGCSGRRQSVSICWQCRGGKGGGGREGGQ